MIAQNLFRQMALFITICVMVVCGFNLALASEATPTSFGVHENAQEIKKLELEEWLVWRITKDLSQFVSLEHFKVYANVEFKNERNSVRRVSNLNLSMFGTVASVVSVDRPVPHQGLFGKVAKLELSLVVSSEVSARTVEAMTKVMRVKIPIIAPERITSNVIHMDRPAWNVTQFLREYKSPIFWWTLAGILLFALFHISKHLRIQTSFRVGPAVAPAPEEVVPELPTSLVPLTPVEAITEHLVHGKPAPYAVKPGFVAAPGDQRSQPGHELSGSLFAKTLESLELRKLRSLALTMSLEECVTYVKANTPWSAVMMSLLTPEKAEKVMARLTPEERKKMMLQTLDLDAAQVAAQAEEIHKSFSLYRGQKSEDTKGSERLVVYLDQVGPFEEEKVFQELLTRRDYERFANLVRHALPTELLPKLPEAAFHASFLRMTHDDRIELLAFSPKEIVDRAWKALGHSSEIGKSLIHEEVKKLQEKIRGGDSVPSKALGRLMSEVRNSLRQNYEFAEVVKPFVEHFIWQRTKGLQGVEYKPGASPASGKSGGKRVA